MGKFKPAIFGLTVILISTVSLAILASAVVDNAIGLGIPPPQLRTVGDLGRGTELSAEKLGLTESDPVMIAITDPDTNETTLVEIVEETDQTLTVMKEDGTQITLDKNTFNEVDPTAPTIQCDEGQSVIDGKCQNVDIIVGGETLSIIDVKDPIACWLEVTAEILDNNGNVIGTEKAGFFKTLPVPQLSLTDIPTGKSIDEQGGFNVMPMIKCSTSEIGGLSTTGDPFFTIPLIVYPSFDIPLTLEATKLVARVWSVSPEGDRLVDTFNFEVDIPRLEITSAEAMTIGTIRIPSERILVFLPDGMYDSIQHIVLDGTLVLHWKTDIPEIDQVNYPITLQTNLIRNLQGEVVRVENPLTIFREIAVEKNVGEDPPPTTECEPDEVLVGGICVKITGDECPKGQVRVGVLCVEEGDDPTAPNIFQKFLICIQSGASNCFLSSEFIPFYFIGVGLIVFVGAVAQRKQPQIYGVPSGF